MNKRHTGPTSSCRVCLSAQRTVKSLRLATEILRREGLLTETFSASGCSCQTLREQWSEWTASQLTKVKQDERKFRLVAAFKGTKTLFDEPCRPCDAKAGAEAREEWARRALFSPQFTDRAVLEDIKSRARHYMGTRWWKEKSVGVAYVPDQKGCAELERGCGGTLSVLRPWDSRKEGMVFKHGVKLGEDGRLERDYNHTFWQEDEKMEMCPREGPTTYCRIGTAKKKSKTRVVTMQSARAKRILRPVHEAAYNHLAKQPWLVRGDPTAEQFAAVAADRLEGETFNSGDFEASTDNLNKDAVFAVVEVLGEALPARRRKVLLDTFQHSYVKWGKKFEETDHNIVRGSMMGNLVSFVVLCLLNKICLDRARQKVEDCGPTYRPAMVNGDDLFFAGSDELFNQWVLETKEIGFVINLKKTMRSKRWGDLNSMTFDFRRRLFVPRLDFGFLGTNLWKEPEGTVADCLFSLVSRIRFATAAWLLNLRPIQEIFSRLPPALSLIPRRWWQFLVKKRWFRDCLSMSDPLTVSSGVERKLPFVLGPPLIESSPAIEKEIARLDRKVIRSCVGEWRGVMACPISKKVRGRALPSRKNHSSNIRLARGRPEAKRLWLEPVLSYLQRNYFDKFLYDKNETWICDQPGLQFTIPLIRSSIRPIHFAPAFGDCVPELNAEGETIYRLNGTAILPYDRRWTEEEMSGA
ncbi:MAG: RNA-dependent RNA polymerase [Phaeoacremonium minimum ourmia-like virus 3]|uniref:RNA-dependent RNA polymerase n=1 Tax=Phaeoacremonium minimum ourmia-like virus 3 TaxID=2587562 RepID=UPI002481CC39|nr:MAG: RNA-dependent RNA polymerase [Phaeoacremonium minimum ourmia-like virus 3]QDB75009.1 MAG: RNA-dependent RNA polymerase [Phaeoacremonium minimum ourmia-like virus 3]